MSVSSNYQAPVQPGSSLYQNAFNNNGQLTGLAGVASQNATNALGTSAPQWQAATVGAAPMTGAAQVGNANTAQAPGVSQSGADYQNTLLQQLQGQALGNGPGQQLAQNNFNNTVQQGTAQQQALAATQGGRNPALAAKNAATNTAGLTANAGSNLQNNSLQAQLNAQQGLAGVAGTVQGQNLSEANYGLGANQFNAGQLNQFGLTQAQLQQQANLANQQMQGQYGLTQAQLNQAANSGNAGLQQNQFQLGNQAAQGWLGQAGGLYQTALGNQQAGAQLYSGAQTQANAINQQGQNANVSNAIAGAKAAGGLIAGAAAASDERVKKGKRSPQDAVSSFLQALAQSKTYEYKEGEKPGRGKGKHTSPMAQDLEKTEAKRYVKDTPNGKAVEYANPHFIGLMAAALGQLHERLEKMSGEN